MRIFARSLVATALLLSSFLALDGACAKAQAKPTDQTRATVLALFNQGRRLDALPLLERLAKTQPKDGEILTALAASLVDHAATLSDRDVAAAERFRAKVLLQEVWKLGKPSPLAENLRQLLEQLPADGALTFSYNPRVQRAMMAGEAAFAKNDYDQALVAYAEALRLEPANYAATLFTADADARKGRFVEATNWYARAIRLDPDRETAYRYYADLLAKRGNMRQARAMLIEAAVAEPYNRIVWREIRAWSIINHSAYNLVYLPIPSPESIAGKDFATSSRAAWRAYDDVKSEWRNGRRFQEQFPQEAQYRHSLREETEALTAAAKILESAVGDRNTDRASADPVADLLLRLYKADCIEPYVLFSLGDDDLAKDYVSYRTKNRARLEYYLDKYVVPPAPR